jgi:hypothetical protein
MPIESVRIAFVDDEVLTTLVDNVTVRVFSTSGQFITSATSGVLETGTAHLELEGSPEGIEYQLRFFLPGAAAPARRILVYSPASAAPTLTNDFLVTVEVFSLEGAPDPKMCRASGYLIGPARKPRRGVDITFLPKFDAFVDETSAAMPGRFVVRTDDRGFASVDLYRMAMYEVTIEGREVVTRNVEVPDRASILLAHLLFPVVVAVQYAEPPPFTVQAGQTLLLLPRVIATDFRDLGTAYADVSYTTLDPSIASVQILGDRIAIRGIRPGTTTLRVSRLDQSIVYLPDYGVQGGDVSITVTPRT